jgi:hypothetical protein
MKTYLAALALAAALAQPASAITFSKLTTIYVGAGVRDNAGAADMGLATLFICSNVSGVTTSIRFVVLDSVGTLVASSTFSAAHGETITAATHLTAAFFESNLSTGFVGQGVINIESLQSGVFCTAAVIDADSAPEFSVPLHMVRINPHPGSVE